MGRFRMVALALALTAAGTGCGSDSGGGSTSSTGSASATTVPAPAPSAAGTTVAPSNLTLRMTDLRLVNSEESDNGIRVLLPAGVTTASVTLTGLPTPNRVISVCQARELDLRMNGAACSTPANGEAVTLALGAAASGVEIVQVGGSGAGPAANAAALDEVTIRYAASSRELNIRLPQIAAGESGGRPTFGITPASADGAYRATLTWKVIPVFGGTFSNAQLMVLQGGNVANEAQTGGPEVRLSGNVPTPVGDVAIRVQNIGSSALVTPKMTAVLP